MTSDDYVMPGEHFAPCILLGLAGRSGSGKDTAAQHLVQHYGFVQVAFADPIRDALEAWLDERGEDYAHLHEPRLKPLPIKACNGRSARQLMQTLGDWGRAQHPLWWVQQLAHRIGLANPDHLAPVHDRIVVSDVRYPNEAAWLRQLGGHVLRVHRAAADSGAWTMRRTHHSSEEGLHAGWVHHEIDNHGSLAALHDALDTLMHRLGLRRQPELYRGVNIGPPWTPIAQAATQLSWPRLLDGETSA